MNIIIDDLPYEVEGHEIMPDFRNMIRLEILLKEDELWTPHKTITALRLLYRKLPHDTEKAIQGLLWFYSRGKEQEESDSKKPTPDPYDYDVDADDFYSAFRSVYNINLARVPTGELHWWEFCALLWGLPSDTRIKEKMHYRTIDLSTIKDKKERDRVAKIKRAFAIKRVDFSKMTPEERDDHTMSYYDKILPRNNT